MTCLESECFPWELGVLGFDQSTWHRWQAEVEVGRKGRKRNPWHMLTRHRHFRHTRAPHEPNLTSSKDTVTSFSPLPPHQSLPRAAVLMCHSIRDGNPITGDIKATRFPLSAYNPCCPDAILRNRFVPLPALFPPSDFFLVCLQQKDSRQDCGFRKKHIGCS